jgi:GT2 family glycosyltransferase
VLPDISVIVTTYNSAGVIEAFFESLARIIDKFHLSIETIITDNDSTDGTQAIIRKHLSNYPNLNITFLANKRNIGLSKALNNMIANAAGERILICNPDIVFTDDFHEMLVISRRFPRFALVPELLDSDGQIQRVVYKRFPTLLRLISDVTAIGSTLPVIFGKVRRDYRYVGRIFNRPIDAIEHTSAVCMLIHRDVVSLLVPFYDPIFPVYWNDVDMSKRAEQLGIPRVIVPGARIYHGLSHSIQTSNPERIAMLFFSSHGLIGYARRWGLNVGLLRIIMFWDGFLKILKVVGARAVGRQTRRLARSRSLDPITEEIRRSILSFRCSLR